MIRIASASKWVCPGCMQRSGLLSRPSIQRLSPLRKAYISTTRSLNSTLDLDYTRNIGIIAHIDAGKTTTTERMLYYGGFTRRIGDVDEGSTVTDFLPAERARGITIQSAAITFHWPPKPSGEQTPPTLDELKSKDLPRSAVSHTVNLIDTPGHADFTFEVLRSLRILDGAVCILDGVAGVEAQTEKVWHQASIYRIPRIVYINKLDREGAAFGRTVKEVGSRLGGWPAVCQIPWFEGGDRRFQGVGDAVSLQGLLWEEGGDGKTVKMSTLSTLEEADTAFASELKKARIALVELLSEHDENMVESFLETDGDHLAVKPIDIINSLRRCVLQPNTSLIPVFAGASFRNIGVQPLLDSVINLLPSPNERSDPEVSIGSAKGGLQSFLSGELVVESSKVIVIPDKKKKQSKTSVSAYSAPQTALQKLEGCALAFKVVSDAKRGVLVYVRVYSGTIARSANLFNTNLNLSEKAPRLLKMYASDAVEVPEIQTGHIGVLVGLKYARTGDTLLSYPSFKTGPPEPINTLQLRPINVPPPVFFASLEPHSLSEEKHMHEALALLLREDPSLQVTVDEDSGQTLLSGMGELHLEIARDRLVNDFKAKASMGQIEIGYRECISEPSPPVTKIFDREIAGRKGKAGCTALVEPYNPDEPYESSSSSNEVDNEDIILDETRDGNRITIIAPGLGSSLNNTPSPTLKSKPSTTSNDLLPSHLTLPLITSALYNGALGALARGPKHSFPLHNTHVTLTFSASSHIFGPETTPSAISASSRTATQAALKHLSPSAALMEPVMNVTISVDEASMGAVIHDISSARGGHIISLDDDHVASHADAPVPIDVSRIYAPPDPFGDGPVSSRDTDSGGSGGSSSSGGSRSSSVNQSRSISAKVPLKEMVGYLKHLRSLTGGRATFVMSVDRFERMGAQREKAAMSAMTGL
ncbi:translation elongation factor G [Polytolypa hystricis UAMH7299]|uniref:Ribosome-releasing factor 2, mitochondrial n=1 Tax=Polytolypa hystricis (strain UAMH7299) TaxID=1447883 RepID=A0A2B7YHF9_POLH7|nr:translation elongation factor G [Polytolypa hystricis UAMH7299]